MATHADLGFPPLFGCGATRTHMTRTREIRIRRSQNAGAAIMNVTRYNMLSKAATKARMICTSRPIPGNTTTPVGRATQHALRLGDRLTAWARTDRVRRTKEAAKFWAVLEGRDT